MAIRIIDDKNEAKKLALRFCPIILQEWKQLEDFPSPLNFDTEEQMRKNLVFAMRDPTLYFRMSEDHKYRYAFYMVFHAFDWSDSKFSIVRNLDSHLYDTEGLCFRISKVTGNCDVATIYHSKVKLRENAGATVWIQAEGHGIQPYEEKLVKDNPYTVYPPKSFTFVNLDEMSDAAYQRITKMLNVEGVDAPHQQAADGTLFTKPDVFFNKNLGETHA